MCWQAAAQAGSQTAFGMFAQNAQNASTVDQMRRQKLQMITQMNFTETNLRNEERTNLEDAIYDMNQLSLNNIRNMGTIRSAIAESGLAGNSMDRIMRITSGDSIRAQMNLTENYEKNYAAILGKRSANYLNMRSQWAAMGEEPRVQGFWENVADPLGIGVGKLGRFFTGGNPMFKSLNKKVIDKVRQVDSHSTGY